MKYEKLSEQVIGCAVEVHRNLGPGLLESTYEQCLACELDLAGIEYKRQHPLPVSYKSIKLECGYRVDLLIKDCIIVEIKCADELSAIHEAQVLTYMKLADVSVGLLINFNVTQLIKGVKRFVL